MRTLYLVAAAAIGSCDGFYAVLDKLDGGSLAAVVEGKGLDGVPPVTGDGGIDLELSDSASEKERRAYISRRIGEILERISAAAGCDGGYQP